MIRDICIVEVNKCEYNTLFQLDQIVFVRKKYDDWKVLAMLNQVTYLLAYLQKINEIQLLREWNFTVSMGISTKWKCTGSLKNKVFQILMRSYFS